ncbi:MAG: DUF6261 family protein [Tannerella sp.]|jgi:hypothetical protein|nr:DUF6261 family protein [Tannerella sp.]
MEIELRKPEVYNYSNADHVEFHKQSYPICEKYAEVINAPDLLAVYNGEIIQEETIYKWIRKSDFTEKKAVTDHARDETYNGIMRILRTGLKSPSRRERALHVYNLLDNYGNLAHADYDAETAAIDSVITRLYSDDYQPDVAELGLQSWVAELKEHNDRFKTYVADTTKEQLDKPGLSPKDARRRTDEALRRITARVTSLINLNGPAAYTGFVEEFNVLVNHYNTLVHEHYGRLHARTDITAADITPIPVQPFTGAPVYVIPVLTLHRVSPDGAVTTVVLVFSQDYTVAYRNNVGPGTATLIIKGIGRYAGEIVTTFNIKKIEN